ncbi:hypothetical protein [Halorarum salinum]|uniref:Uncharacterized protein n=1 Tax=Halorarum salinum TaxID=2743089 RepID=A0A7D5LBI6_9EURY|nr:hypothetical protein [Halobaculum salinum]QLG62853.1 hypothetical protein HUG12_14395 [Halobaculum salinum]
MSQTNQDNDTHDRNATAVLQQIKDDRSKALRAPKDTSNYDYDGDARTAARYIGDCAGGTPMFEIVSTRVRKFPEGSDMHDEHEQRSIKNWILGHEDSIEVIDVEDEDGFLDREVPA